MERNYFYDGPNITPHRASIDPHERPMPEGTVVWRKHGKYVKQPAVKKAKPFEVGKTYKMIGGIEVRILCIDRPACASVVSMSNCGDVFYNRLNGVSYSCVTAWNIIPEYEQTPEQIVFVEGE